MENTFITIVTLVYNTKKDYLCQCLDSLASIKYDNYEILIIDDGSNQETKDILDSYKSKLKCNIIHQENKGISASRLVAINNAKGDYILYVDSDDVADEDCLNNINKIVKEYNPDVIHFDDIRFKENINNVISSTRFLPEGVISKDEALKQVCLLHINGVSNKIVKKSLYKDMYKYIDTTFINGEDFQQTAYLIVNANKIYCAYSKIFYCRINDEYRAYYGDNIVNDVNFLIPGYKIIFENNNNKELLSIFKKASTKLVIYTSFKLCAVLNSYKDKVKYLDKLNNQEIITILDSIDKNISMPISILYSLFRHRIYSLFVIFAAIYKKTFGFDVSIYNK